ncbi:helix-turn-helix domain-containing protein [Secundilactobacillus collinoides]|nr:helix-turn-helix domain-containing protein [Secundilactobacillus collinoides]
MPATIMHEGHNLMLEEAGEVQLKLFELLDHSDVRQIKMIQLLSKQRGSLTVNQIAKTFAINVSTVREDIKLIAFNLKALGPKLAVVNIDGEVSLLHSGDVSFSDVYYHYLHKSVKYQVLIYLLNHRQFKIQRLADRLSVSTSTLIRRIREINRSLAEFNIGIKNTQLFGCEAQIRYFYFQLLWLGRPIQVNRFEYADDRVAQLLKMGNFESLLTETGKVMLTVYFGLVKQRLTAVRDGDIDYESFNFRNAGNAPFIKQFSDNLQHYFHQVHLSWDARELNQAVGFLVIHFCFNTDEPSARQFVGHLSLQFPKIDTLNRRFIRTVGRIPLAAGLPSTFTEETKLSLSQIHFCLAFYRGALSPDISSVAAKAFAEDELSRFSDGQAANELVQKCYQLCEEAFHTLAISAQDSDKFDKILMRYAVIVNMALGSSNSYLTIACDFNLEQILNTAAIARVGAHINQHIKVSLQPYEADQNYDLIITDQMKPYPHHDHSRVFVLLGMDYGPDFTALNQVLKQLYFDKLQF